MIMAKRFLDTGFLQQKWIRKLRPDHKIFLIYLMLECDNAGIIDLDMDDAEFWIGKKIGDPLKFLPEGYLIPINDTGKYFQPKFIEWQYPNFPHSKVHQQKQAKEILLKNGMFDVDNQLIVLPKLYLNFTQPLPDGQVNGNVDDNASDNVDVIVMPFDDEKFINAWKDWKQYKKEQHRFTYKSHMSEQAALKQLGDMSNGSLEYALEIIFYTIAQGYQGLYEPKNKANKPKNIIQGFAESYQKSLKLLQDGVSEAK